MDTDICELIDDDLLFDPFEDDEEDAGAPLSDDEDSSLLIGEALEEREPVVDTRPPRERIEEMLEKVRGHKRVFLQLIDYCREPKSASDMDARTEELTAHAFSVYSPVVIRELLEGASAIEYLKSEEERACDAAEATGEEPFGERARERYFNGTEEVELEYLEIGEVQQGLWTATADGLAVVDEQDDLGESRELLAQEPYYLDIYHQILDYCSDARGRTVKEIDRLVNDSPLLEEPRRYSGYFVSRLEQKGSLEWRGGWYTTDIGKTVLEESNAKAAVACA